MRDFLYAFTVFTPTYNRARTLSRVYESLKQQTCRDFEWLVIDDGSTDETAQLIEGWTRQATFPIRYIRQHNHGKHIAHNRAIREAHGALFVTLDSDDACVPNALERLLFHWKSVPDAERGGFSAVTALCKAQDGRIVGDRFPADPFDATLAEMMYRYDIRGEKWGFQRTDLLRQFPFPDVPNVGYVPEGIIWHRVGLEYRMRFVNEPLRFYHENEDLSLVRAATSRPAAHAFGRRLYYGFVLNHHLQYLSVAPGQLYKAAVQFARSSFHLGDSVARQFRALNPMFARVLWLAALPVAVALWGIDRVRARGAS